MFFNNDDLLDKARQEHIRLMKENAELRAENAMLREPAKIAREAIERFCHPELLTSADNWLRAKGV